MDLIQRFISSSELVGSTNALIPAVGADICVRQRLSSEAGG